MSGLEAIGIAASILQLADMCWGISYKLFTFSKQVQDAGVEIDFVSREVASTGVALQQLGHELKTSENSSSQVCSPKLLENLRQTINGCENLFKALQGTVDEASNKKAVLGIKQKLKWSLLRPKIEPHRRHLESLKGSILIMLNVIIYAGQVKRNEEHDTLQAQRVLLAELQREKVNSAKVVGVSGRPKFNSSPEPGPGVMSVPTRNEAEESDTESDTLRQEGDKAVNLVPGGLLINLFNTGKPGTRDLGLNDSLPPVPSPLDDLGNRSPTYPGPRLRRHVPSETTTDLEIAHENEMLSKQAKVTLKERKRIVRLPSPDLILPLPSAELIALHAHLVNRLISALRKPEYEKLDIDQLHRLREALLQAHFEEWKQFAHTTSERTLADHLSHAPVLRNSWVKRCKEDRDKEAQTSLDYGYMEDMRNAASQVAYTMQGMVHLLEAQHTIGPGRYGKGNGQYPPWSKIHRKYIDTRTLEYYHLPWEWDKTDPHHMIIKRWLDDKFREELVQHTRELRYGDAETRWLAGASTGRTESEPPRLPRRDPWSAFAPANTTQSTGPNQDDSDALAILEAEKVVLGEFRSFSEMKTGAYKPQRRDEYVGDAPNATSAPAAEQPVEYTAVGPPEMSAPGAAGGFDSEDGEDDDSDYRSAPRRQRIGRFKRNPGDGGNNDEDGDDAEEDQDDDLHGDDLGAIGETSRPFGRNYDPLGRDYDELLGREDGDDDEDYEDDVEDSDDDDGLFSVPLSAARPVPPGQRPTLGVDPDLDRYFPKQDLSSPPQAPAQTGCGPCRRRELKCDEARPRCGQCTQLDIICYGNPRRPLQKDTGEEGQQLQTQIDHLLSEWTTLSPDEIALAPHEQLE